MDDPVALCWAGHALGTFFDEIDQAVSLVNRATELDMNLAVAWARRGWVYAWAGDPDCAIDSLNRAIRLNTLDPRIFLTFSAMALAHFVGRRAEEAAAWAVKALQVKPDWPPALRAAAASFGVLGMQKEAAKVIATLIQVVPSSRLSTLPIFLRKKDDREYWINGLRRAGFPE